MSRGGAHRDGWNRPEHGLTDERLAECDVLVWWGHKAHGEVSEAVVERVQRRGARRHGIDRSAFWTFLQDLPPPEWAPLLSMARGG